MEGKAREQEQLAGRDWIGTGKEGKRWRGKGTDREGRQASGVGRRERREGNGRGEEELKERR